MDRIRRTLIPFGYKFKLAWYCETVNIGSYGRRGRSSLFTSLADFQTFNWISHYWLNVTTTRHLECHVHLLRQNFPTRLWVRVKVRRLPQTNHPISSSEALIILATQVSIVEDVTYVAVWYVLRLSQMATSFFPHLNLTCVSWLCATKSRK